MTDGPPGRMNPRDVDGQFDWKVKVEEERFYLGEILIVGTGYLGLFGKRVSV